MLKGKNAIVTGARRGIGRATVEVFAQNGANVWACIREDDPTFEQEMKALSERYGVWIKPVCFDLLSEEQVKKAVREIAGDKKAIDILVNNAGVAYYDAFTMMPVDNIRKMLESNYIAPLRLTQMLVRRMMKNGGSMVFLSSVSGLEAESGNTAYGGSKAAVAHAVGVLSRELAQYGIRVNAVAPGLVDTDMQNQADKRYWEEMIDRIYLKRMARPEEIANVICFLASDLASYVNGQVLRIDGGMK